MKYIYQKRTLHSMFVYLILKLKKAIYTYTVQLQTPRLSLSLPFDEIYS